jgi:hypothetical protein
MQSAAGGTSHRLNPAVAMMRSRSRMLVPAPPAGIAIVVMRFPPVEVLSRFDFVVVSTVGADRGNQS